MNINDDAEILAIRVDQNNGSYFRAYVGQHFAKAGFTIAEIYQDMNDRIELKNEVYKIRVRNIKGTEYIWQKFVNHKNVQITYMSPDMTELEQINQLFDEGGWS